MAVGAAVGGSSVVGWWILDAVNNPRDRWFVLPDWFFIPALFVVVVVYPIVSMCLCYRRIAYLRLACAFACAFGVGWFVTMEIVQSLQYSIWKGFRPHEETVLNLLVRWGKGLAMTVGITLAVGLMVWAVCRLVRGRIILTSLACRKCSYDLTGNVSGVCPECGTAVEAG